jgi:hypothetical protein
MNFPQPFGNQLPIILDLGLCSDPNLWIGALNHDGM